ncbi:MAG: sulfite exporter TauE/SafE family protein, partial [Pseudolabrys sp.]|nr:sulfite exporter TauE/SafE family protein [Pseudolabrys sp.]
KDTQRAIFQPVILAAFAMTAVSLAFAGAVTADLVRLYLYGLPALAAGLWLGIKLYGRLDEAAFRRVILVLLLLSGLTLIVPWSLFT